MIKHAIENLEFYSFESFGSFPEITNVAVSRKGGASEGVFASLNMSLNAGDARDVVLDNRTRLSLLTGAAPDLLTLAGQVHGARVAVIPDGGLGGGGAGRVIAKTDAMITDMADVPMVILAADCAVVSLYDPVNGAVGLAHAGWRGTLRQIAARTVEKMTEAYGTEPARLVAAIGPCIGPCCYEVGKDVIDGFFTADPDTARCVLHTGQKKGKARLDLVHANRLALEAAGVPAGSIEESGICTACNTAIFYSHRAEGGRTGRFAGLLMIHGKTRRAY